MAEDKWKRDLWKIIDDGARIIYDFALHRLSTKDGTFIYYIWASENFQMTFFFASFLHVVSQKRTRLWLARAQRVPKCHQTHTIKLNG